MMALAKSSRGHLSNAPQGARKARSERQAVATFCVEVTRRFELRGFDDEDGDWNLTFKGFEEQAAAASRFRGRAKLQIPTEARHWHVCECQQTGIFQYRFGE